MAQQVRLEAATRTRTGKGAARSLRREGKVPAVIYGHGREPETLVLEESSQIFIHAFASPDKRQTTEQLGIKQIPDGVKRLLEHVCERCELPSGVIHEPSETTGIRW